ncbi:uncharacterized protein LAESUDRAFT_811030 [Laetiporus sulphureus 93-53]|uniref:UvrD-like helicase ATP-binding domain-containing protein n=1 Tax=Laetiporus sulphureus 93-53 TaxID=1314785 RepID=A0A165FGB3_9APHY|nr:uncharacterized protein LAESUDRAFT_811030 [Laetiporus sulphureus 93-53]KZT08927.1 hypothetical protein LAESUDRAFT_811030 [Laetiporus sulphureus 93-53]
MKEKPSQKLSYKSFDVAFLDARRLVDEVAIESALSVLEGHLFNPAASIESMLRDLTAVPNLFEFAISSLGESAASKLFTRIVENFPVGVEGVAASPHRHILERWSHSLRAHSHLLSAKDIRSLQDHCATLERSLKILDVLASSLRALPGDNSDVVVAGSGTSERSRNHTYFVELAISIPCSIEEAEEVVAFLLEKLKSILQYFLTMIRHPQLSETFRSAYIPVNYQVQRVSPNIRRVNYHIHFDGANGFGPWRLLLSPRAEGHMRTAYNKVPTLFEIIVTKFRTLSNGYFTHDNHNRLSGTEEGVPIYEGRVNGKLCYVYQIDCEPASVEDAMELQEEEQVLKIHGIFTHSKMKWHIWKRLSRQLARSSPEYVQRCVLLSDGAGKKDVIHPKKFNSISQHPVMEPPSVPVQPDLQEDFDLWQSVIFQKNYTDLSKCFLASILEDPQITPQFDPTDEQKEIMVHPSSCYILGRSGTGKTTVILFKMLWIERSWMEDSGISVTPRQLFITRSRDLAVEVEKTFFRLYESKFAVDDPLDKLSVRAGNWRQQVSRFRLVDLDEEAKEDGELPQRFTDLKEEHFPLFLSSDELWRMLEADLQISSTKKLISYDVFLNEYWRHFSVSLTRGLDPALVFNEIIGVIEGSEGTLHSRNAFLDEKTYTDISRRAARTFSDQRKTIYDIFVAYLKRKRERGEQDPANRFGGHLRQHGLPGVKLDYIYADEAQDNLLIDALVLRNLCRNPIDGLVWAGDTAQTIADGNSFRFEDLKAFLYRVENSDPSPSRPHVEPHFFPLALNNRSHSGIVDCAHAIIKLITRFWPDSIDRLPDEKGKDDGPKPVFVREWKPHAPPSEGNEFDRTLLGADQCILVRNDAVRKQLRARTSTDVGRILILQECKGLEFNDVFLYHFFEDSMVGLTEWRALQASAESEDNALRHAVLTRSLCRELKFLYVAITRARCNVWIVDDSERAAPMRDFWLSRGLIQDDIMGGDVPKPPQEDAAIYIKFAQSLFRRKLYGLAMDDYMRGKRPREQRIAHAYSLREDARAMAADQLQAFRLAAHAFQNCAREAEDTNPDKYIYFRISAECFLRGGDVGSAARQYLEARKYTRSAQLYREAGMFDEAMYVVRKHRSHIQQEAAEGIVDVARMFYLGNGDIRKARKLFNTNREAVDYLEQHGSSLVSAVNITKAMVLEETGDVEQAVNVYFEEGHTITAIQRITANSRNLQWAAESLLRYLWQNLSLGLDVHSASTVPKTAVDALLLLLCQKNVHCLREATYQEMLAFRGILLNDDKALIQLASNPSMLKHNAAAALLCLDYVFSKPFELSKCSTASITSKLRAFLRYVTSLRSFAFCKDISDDSNVRRLLQFEPTSDGSYLVRPNTLLHGHCKSTAESVGRSWKGNYLLIRGHRMNSLLKQALSNHLISRVTNENQDAHGALIHHDNVPCMIGGHHACQHPTCCECGAAYGLPVLIHLQQILIYHSTRGLLGAALDEKRYWLNRLYFVLRPAIAHSDILDIARDAMAPEFEDAFAVVKCWVQHVLLQKWSPKTSELFLSGFSPMALALNGSIVLHVSRNMVPIGRFIRPADGINVVHCLTSFLTNGRSFSLVDGVFFVSHILEHRIPIDICLLCDLLDNLCGALVVERQYQEQSSLHNVVLPMSWLIRAVMWHRRTRNTVTNVLPIYFEPLEQLLEQIYSGLQDNNLRYNGESLRQAAGDSIELRHTFIARICANLHFLGENLQYEWLQEDLLSTMRSIRKPKRLYHASYKQYVTAATWKMLRMDQQSACRRNGIVQLCEKGRQPREHMTIVNVRTIEFTNLDELPALLGMETSSPTRTDTSTQSAEPISTATIAPPIAMRAAYKKKSRAAQIILRAYRRYHLRRRGVPSHRHIMRVHFFKEFQGQVPAMRWARSRYRLLYLGAVPHLLVCLEYMARHLRPLVATKLRWVTRVDHIKLEEALRDLRETTCVVFVSDSFVCQCM